MERVEMTVHFIGAGPGAPDLLTLRGRDLIASCPVCLYAGSLVPTEILAHCPRGARIVNTAPLALDEIIAEIAAAHAQGKDIARLHSGDLSVWSAMGEQLRRLRELNIPFTVTPGVPSFAAAAAALEAELTLPGLAQSVVLTRTSGRASAMPEGESLAAFAKTGATLAIHLSVHVLDKVISELSPYYGADCPVAVVWRASWPDERIVRATLGTLRPRSARNSSAPRSSWSAALSTRPISTKAGSMPPTMTAAIGPSAPRRVFRRRRDAALPRYISTRLRRRQDHADPRARTCLSRSRARRAVFQERP
jgi:precorrin-4/cobalt-precorrin-4 C11-methyltransferase